MGEPEAEKNYIFGVAGAYLSDLEEPPTYASWCCAGYNRVAGRRRVGGLRVMWRGTAVWHKKARECWDYMRVTGEILCVLVAV